MVPTMAELASFFEVYAVDLPGLGLSDKPPEALDVARLPTPSPPGSRRPPGTAGVAVANSVGSQVAVDCAVRRSKRVGRLVLVGPTTDPVARNVPGRCCAGCANMPGEKPGQLP